MLQKFFVAAMGLLSFTLVSAQTASVSYDTTGASSPAEEKKRTRAYDNRFDGRLL